MYVGLASLVCVGLTASMVPAKAMMIMASPISQRVATADVVVVGKVTGFGDKTVSVASSPGAKEKTEYQIAIVKIETNIHGAKGMKEIRVGFIPQGAGGRPGGPIIRPGFRRPSVNLALNQEACLFLTKHAEGDFYVAPAYFSIINKKDNPNFKKEVAEITRYAKLLADPKAGLDSKNKDDQLMTAALLIYNYRTPKFGFGEPKMKPVDAAFSKKILLVLANAKWAAARPGGPVRPGGGIGVGAFQATPQNLFFQLGLTEKDGWVPPKNGKIDEAAKKWLKDNAGKYRIQQFVYEKAEKKSDKSEKSEK
jgi:hypothetical protein